MLAVIAAGGMLGSLARCGAGLLAGETAWPWPILLVNTSGCLLIGVLMAVLLDLTAPHRLLRPFLGIGVLGGYTTFSTYAVDVQRLVVSGREVAALAYVLVTPVLALVAVWVGTVLSRSVRGRGRA
ncbi:CrcB family protein [Jiangella ureilytica]|uniref:Fluoride-specific ion channel FluC n=1 Tax=Jiangella ureilytica TaxID=2530374 RepID=A0A4R4RNK9_9ACTN|nr:CrcB family protein [Jiangella ureilytica]